MRSIFHLFFCFFLFLYQSFVFIQTAEGQQNWNETEIQRFSDALKTSGISEESISILIEAADYSQMQKITSFFQDLEAVQEPLEGTAADIFFEYVFSQVLDIDTVMGDDWVDRLIEDTEGWTAIEAESFLVFLESENIGIEFNSILKILKATNYLRAIKANQITFTLEEETTLVPEQASQAHPQATETLSYETASDVFIHFARQQFRKELEQEGKSLEDEAFEEAFKKRMGNKGEWEKRISENTTNVSKWTAKDAQDLLSFLRERIGDSDTLKAMKKTSFFSNTNYGNFILRFNIFSRYVDKEGMAEQLRKRLLNFTKGTPEVITTVIEDIKEYFGEEGEDIVKKALNNNIFVFSLSKNQSNLLGELLNFLENYIGKEGVKDIILNKPSGFILFRVKKDSKSKTYILQMPLVVEYIESYFGDKDEGKKTIQDIMQKSFHGLAKTEHKKLETVIKYIEDYFEDKGKEAVKEIMKKSFHGLAIAELEKLQKVVEYIEDYFEDKDEAKEAVKEIIQNSFTGLAIAEWKKLENVVEYIERYFGDEGKKTIQDIMQKSFQGLAVAEREKLKDVVEYIEGYFENKDEGKEVIQEIMKNSFKGLATAELEKLEDVIKYIEGYFENKDEGKKTVQDIMQKSFTGLAIAEHKN